VAFKILTNNLHMYPSGRVARLFFVGKVKFLSSMRAGTVGGVVSRTTAPIKIYEMV